MELFWIIFWVLLLAVPALWLVSVLWTVVLYIVIFTIGGIVGGISWIYRKVTGRE